MENGKKYIILIKNKISLVENEYLFYKSDVLLINNIIERKLKSVDKNSEFLNNNINYLGKAKFNKLSSNIEFINSFDEIEGNLLVSKGITEDKFIFISDKHKLIELFCLLDRYFYLRKNNLSNNSRYYNRFTVLYGDSINQESLEVKNNTYLDINLIDNVRSLFGDEKLLALESISKINNLDLSLNIKFIEAGKNNKKKDEECVICLEKLGNKYTKLYCRHRFHISCLNDWIKANNSEENKDNHKKLLITCPLCREESNAINKINLLDSKIPILKEGKASLDYSPILSKENSQKNIQLVDFLGNIGFKMVKVNDNCFSLEYNDDTSSKLNYKISKILSVINIIS